MTLAARLLSYKTCKICKRLKVQLKYDFFPTILLHCCSEWSFVEQTCNIMSSNKLGKNVAHFLHSRTLGSKSAY